MHAYPIEKQAEVLGREAVERARRQHVEEAELEVLEGLLLTRDHPEKKRDMAFEITRARIGDLSRQRHSTPLKSRAGNSELGLKCTQRLFWMHTEGLLQGGT